MKLLLSIIWQLPQILIGEIVYLWHRLFMRGRTLRSAKIGTANLSASALIYSTNKSGKFYAYSLGRRIFFYYDNKHSISAAKLQAKINEVLKHEFGHSRQSAITGWFYLPIIAVNSLIITSVSVRMAEKSPVEKWANKLVTNVDLIIN